MADQLAPQRVVVPFSGHVIGEGFNSETVQRVGTALNVGAVGEDPVAPGQTAVFKFQMVTSQASLEKALNIGAELDARYGLFSAGGKFSFAEDSAINSSSTYIIASCVVTNALRSGSGFTPNPSAQPLVAAGDTDGFKRAFGDRFTQALHTGGEFFALVRVTSSNVSHQQQIAASLHAELNGLFTSVSFQASLQEAEKDTSSHTEIDVQVNQTGGVGDQVQIPGTDANRIRDHMNTFAAAAHTNAAAFQAELVSYDILALPFPSPADDELKHQVLADCLAQRQRLWSAISDITFAQGQDAALIFDDLPSAGELADLESKFRAALNQLLDHARRVSTGTIAPTVFVADPPLALPHFKRRTSGSFASWWARAKNNDPGLLRDESLLIADIARAVRPMLTVPIDQAPPEAIERAADTLEELLINGGSDHLDFPRVRSLRSLPQMIDAPLRNIHAPGTNLRDLAGIETFTRITRLEVFDGELEVLDALVALAGLEELNVFKNVVTDLSPLRSLTSLRELQLRMNRVADLTALSGLGNLRVLDLRVNQVEDLTPLASLAALEVLDVSRNSIAVLPSLAGMAALRLLSLNVNGFADDPGGDNPLIDVRGLNDSPRLASLLTAQDRLSVRVFTPQGEPRFSGTASRVGNSNRFDLASSSDGTDEQIQLQGLFEWHDLGVFNSPVVVSALRFPEEKIGVACTLPGDRSRTMTAADLAKLVPDQVPGGAKFETGPFATRDINLSIPSFLLEIDPVTG